MTDHELAKLERAVQELVDANVRLANVCLTQQSAIETLSRERDGYKDMLQALQATMGDHE